MDNRYNRIHPLEVFCGGWRSDTVLLEREGWRFMMEQRDFNRTIRLMMHNPSNGQNAAISFRSFEEYDHFRGPLVLQGTPFTMLTGTPEAILAVQESTPIFMEDAMLEERQSIMMNVPLRELFPQSANPAYAGEAQEIYVPDEKTVDQLLDVILKQQVPEQKVLRDRERKRSRRRATILTLEDAA